MCLGIFLLKKKNGIIHSAGELKNVYIEEKKGSIFSS